MNCVYYILLYCYTFIKHALVCIYYSTIEAFSTQNPLKPLEKEDVVDREGEYAVITGGNRGIGWYTLKGLVRSGMKVIVGCRDGASKDLLFESVKQCGFASDAVEWICLDLSSMDSVRSFAKTILDRNIPISLLINNGGLAHTDYRLTKDGFESHFGVNYLSHFLLTHLLMPLLAGAGNRNKGRCARILNISSFFHRFGWLDLDDLQAKSFFMMTAAYSQSKAAQIMFTQTLSERLDKENQPVHVYAIHPGQLRSNITQGNWLSGTLSSVFRYWYKKVTLGANRVLHTALSTQVENYNGAYFENCRLSQPIAAVCDQNNQRKLWNISCQLLNIEEFGQR